MVHRLSRTERLIRTMTVAAILVVGMVVWVASTTASSAHSTTTSTAISTTTTVAPTTTTLPRTPLGVGLYQTTVVEPGRTLCTPLTTICSVRSYQLQVYYPAITSGVGAVLSAEPAQFLAPFPVILFAHGFDQVPANYYPLISHWVLSGYAVAAPIFPLSSSEAILDHGVQLSDAKEADAYESDLLNQPGDLSAAIGELTSLNGTANGLFGGRINLSEIGAIGQSDGGDTVLASTANTCCIDARIKVAVILSGAEFQAYPGQYFATSTNLPTLVVQGSADTVNLPAASQLIYSGLKGPKFYLDLIGADHLGPYTDVNPFEASVASVTTKFLGEYLLGQPGGVGALLSAGNVPGVSQLTAG